MARLIQRDPFARTELWRERDYYKDRCSNCGFGRLTKKGEAYTFHYYVETDGGRRYDSPNLAGRDDKKRFCSKSCYVSFYN